MNGATTIHMKFLDVQMVAAEKGIHIMDGFLFYLSCLGMLILLFIALGMVCCIRINHNILYPEPNETAVLSDGLSELENESVSNIKQKIEEMEG